MSDQSESGKTGDAPEHKAQSSGEAIPSQSTPRGSAAENQLNNAEKELSSFERWTLRLAWAGFLIAVVTGVVFYLQFREMSKQTGILSDQAKQAAIDSGEASRKVEEQLSIARKQADAAQDQATAAKKSAEATQTQARVAEEGVEAVRKQMRQDQRPWLRIQPKSGTGTTFMIGQPLQSELAFTNTGKSPARHFFAYCFVEVVAQGSAPKLINPEHPGPEQRQWSFLDTGILFPNQTIEGMAIRNTLKPGSQTEVVHDLLKADESRQLSEGRAYVAVYVYAKYWDIFGKRHWTTFCGWTGENPTIGYTSDTCVRYNNVDGQ